MKPDLPGTGPGPTERYARQTALPEIGPEGQARLGAARVLIVGAGGLGSPLALYLAGAGIGTLGILDSDTVSRSNLQRQVLYREDDEGQPKAECAARTLRRLNSDIRIIAHPVRLTAANAEEIISGYDLVADGCDNAETRYLLDEVCRRQGKPYVYGGITDFAGQVSVFHYGPDPRRYRDLFPPADGPSPAGPQTVPVSPAGPPVVGVTPGLTALVQASEVLKIVCGYGTVLSGVLWIYDLRDNTCLKINC